MLFRFMSVAWLPLAIVGCEGDDETGIPVPEDCTNGIDDNGNGLIDCDDVQFCNNPYICRDATDSDTGGGEQKLLEFVWDQEECAHVFGPVPGDCSNKQLCSLRAINRSARDATLAASCDNPNPDKDSEGVIIFQGGGQRGSNLSAVPVARSGTAVPVTLFNNSCDFLQSYNIQCRAQIEAEEELETLNWTIDATFQP